MVNVVPEQENALVVDGDGTPERTADVSVQFLVRQGLDKLAHVASQSLEAIQCLVDILVLVLVFPGKFESVWHNNRLPRLLDCEAHPVKNDLLVVGDVTDEFPCTETFQADGKVEALWRRERDDVTHCRGGVHRQVGKELGGHARLLPRLTLFGWDAFAADHAPHLHERAQAFLVQLHLLVDFGEEIGG